MQINTILKDQMMGIVKEIVNTQHMNVVKQFNDKVEMVKQEKIRSLKV